MSKYTKEVLEPLVKESLSVADVCRKLGLKPNGGNNGNIKKQLLKHNIDISHFVGRSFNKGKISTKKKKWEDILSNTGKSQHGWKLKRAMLEAGVKEECFICKVGTTWCGGELVLQVDHYLGNNTDHRLENLRLLCPNCHSQTPTFSGRKNKFLKDIQIRVLEDIVNDPQIIIDKLV